MNRRPIAVVMIAVAVLTSGCVSRRAYTEKRDQALVLSGALAEEQQKTATLGARAGQLEQQLADAEKRIAAATTERDRLAGERQAQEARAQELAAQLQAASQDLEARSRDLSTAREQLGAASSDLTAVRREQDATRQQLEATRGQLTDAQQALEAARGQVATARRDLDGLSQGLADTRNELGNARQALARTTAERNRVAAEREQIETAARDLAAQLSAIRDQLVSASTELAAARQALAQAQSEAASARQALSGTRGELASVQEALGETKEEMEARERKRQEAIAAYDTLVNDLQQEIRNGQVQISRLQDTLTVKVLDRILFDSGSARIKPSGQELLRKVADTVRGLPGQKVSIEGHTDNVPIKESYRQVFPTNWELSTARATGVARFLQEKGSVDPKSLAAAGYGEFRPVRPNDTPEGRSENRRIEIVLVPQALP